MLESIESAKLCQKILTTEIGSVLQYLDNSINCLKYEKLSTDQARQMIPLNWQKSLGIDLMQLSKGYRAKNLTAFGLASTNAYINKGTQTGGGTLELNSKPQIVQKQGEAKEPTDLKKEDVYALDVTNKDAKVTFQSILNKLYHNKKRDKYHKLHIPGIR